MATFSRCCRVVFPLCTGRGILYVSSYSCKDTNPTGVGVWPSLTLIIFLKILSLNRVKLQVNFSTHEFCWNTVQSVTLNDLCLLKSWSPLLLLLVTKSCLTLCNPMDGSPPGSSVCRILQARILERAAVSFSRGSSQTRDRTCVSCIAEGFFTTEPLGKFSWLPYIVRKSPDKCGKSLSN